MSLLRNLAKNVYPVLALCWVAFLANSTFAEIDQTNFRFLINIPIFQGCINSASHTQKVKANNEWLFDKLSPSSELKSSWGGVCYCKLSPNFSVNWAEMLFILLSPTYPQESINEQKIEKCSKVTFINNQTS